MQISPQYILELQNHLTCTYQGVTLMDLTSDWLCIGFTVLVILEWESDLLSSRPVLCLWKPCLFPHLWNRSPESFQICPWDFGLLCKVFYWLTQVIYVTTSHPHPWIITFLGSPGFAFGASFLACCKMKGQSSPFWGGRWRKNLAFWSSTYICSHISSLLLQVQLQILPGMILASIPKKLSLK